MSERLPYFLFGHEFKSVRCLSAFGMAITRTWVLAAVSLAARMPTQVHRMNRTDEQGVERVATPEAIKHFKVA